MVLKNLLDNYGEFEEIIKNNGDGEIDLANLELNPTLLMLLESYGKNNNIDILNKDSTIEIIDLPKSNKEQQEMNFVDMIIDKLNVDYWGNFTLRHILSELTYNIHEHAFEEGQKTEASISFKLYEADEKLDISIMDYGLSIPGRFDKSNVNYSDDCNSIEMAINNFSTVSDNPYERGNGLWTTIRLVIEGNCGEILIISRKAILHITQNDYEYHLLNDESSFKGTLISIRLNKFEVQNIYELIELHRNNFYEYGG